MSVRVAVEKAVAIVVVDDVVERKDKLENDERVELGETERRSKDVFGRRVTEKGGGRERCGEKTKLTCLI